MKSIPRRQTHKDAALHVEAFTSQFANTTQRITADLFNYSSAFVQTAEARGPDNLAVHE